MSNFQALMTMMLLVSLAISIQKGLRSALAKSEEERAKQKKWAKLALAISAGLLALVFCGPIAPGLAWAAVLLGGLGLLSKSKWGARAERVKSISLASCMGGFALLLSTCVGLEPSGTQVVSAAPQKAAKQGVSAPTLPGLNYVDVTLNLTKPPYGFEEESAFGDLARHTCRKTDEGGLLVVDTYSYKGDVVKVSAKVGADSGASSWLLPYIATVPFDGNGTASKDWVKANLAKAKAGRAVTRTVNGVRFELSGDRRNARLIIAKPAYEAWSETI